MIKQKFCTNCKGAGKQIFHGHFESIVGNCNFCDGSGKREDQVVWFKKLNNITSHSTGIVRLTPLNPVNSVMGSSRYEYK